MGLASLQFTQRRNVIYSNTDILTAINAKHIIIRPYSDEQLQTNSYDLRLGQTFYTEVIMAVFKIVRASEDKDAEQTLQVIREHLPDISDEEIDIAITFIQKAIVNIT